MITYTERDNEMTRKKSTSRRDYKEEEMSHKIGRGWWVQVYDDGSEGGTQHYIPGGSCKTQCGLKFDAVRKRKKFERCRRCYKSTIVKVYHETVWKSK
jgi:hypothetical protein